MDGMVKEMIKNYLRIWTKQAAKYGYVNDYFWRFFNYTRGACDVYKLMRGRSLYIRIEDAKYIFNSLVEFKKGVR